MDANANHDIHNRSRNRKQERLWWKRAAAEPPHPPPPMTSRDDCDHGRLTASLRALCVARHLVETPGGTAQRRGVLRDLDGMLSAWSESLLPGSPSYADNLADPTPNPDRSQAPCLLSFGSYRLGVNAPDADIDCLVLAPPHVTRDDLFGSWVDVLKKERRVTELHPVSSAYTPVIKFEMDAVKIDLIFARVNNSKWLTEQREKMAAAAAAGALADGGGDDAAAAAGDGTGEERTEMRVDDSVLVGLDETSVRSVNGVRVAQFLLDAVGGRPDLVENFRLTLRAVKEWARVHGLYSNVLGFLGGVNWAILVAWVSKRNPDAPASKLLQLFFRTFANWSWPNQVVLSSDQKQPPKGVQPLPVWDPTENYRDKKALMPIITPCYPPMNSAYNVGAPQLRRLRDELRWASSLGEDVLAGRKGWDALFAGSDFFRQHANYLQVDIIASDAEQFRSWFGLCEAKMRILIAGLEVPFLQAYPFAKFFPGTRREAYVSSFFVALRFSHQTKRVDLGPLVADYLRIVNDWEGRMAGMDLEIRLVLKKNLPAFVFEDKEAKCRSDKANAVDVPSTMNNSQEGKLGTEEEAKTPFQKKQPGIKSTTFANAVGSPQKRTKLG